jgi:hypothetical protein
MERRQSRLRACPQSRQQRFCIDRSGLHAPQNFLVTLGCLSSTYPPPRGSNRFAASAHPETCSTAIAARTTIGIRINSSSQHRVSSASLKTLVGQDKGDEADTRNPRSYGGLNHLSAGHWQLLPEFSLVGRNQHDPLRENPACGRQPGFLAEWRMGRFWTTRVGFGR